MSGHNDHGNRRGLMVRIDAELQEMAAALQGGSDVAPARRARLEGVMVIALDTGETTVEGLCESVNAILGSCGVLRVERGDECCEVRLMLRQARAPVWPTTTD